MPIVNFAGGMKVHLLFSRSPLFGMSIKREFNWVSAKCENTTLLIVSFLDT